MGVKYQGIFLSTTYKIYFSPKLSPIQLYNKLYHFLYFIECTKFYQEFFLHAPLYGQMIKSTRLHSSGSKLVDRIPACTVAGGGGVHAFGTCRGGVPAQGGLPAGGVPAQGGTCPGTSPRHCGQTDTCNNITFANFVCGR